MRKKILIVVLGCMIGLFINSGLTVEKENYFSKSGTNIVVPVIGDVPERIEIDQGWDNQTRLKFWFTSQGSQIIPYSWFTWLEQDDKTELFRSVENMEMFRCLPMDASVSNPSGLPIGFTISQAKKGKDQWFGLTCAACHTNQLNYKGKNVLIEGAPTLANFTLFLEKLAAALRATSKEDAKFDRFARKVLAEGFSSKTAEKLREKLLEVTINIEDHVVVSQLPDDFPIDFTSYGRLDAFGNIENAGSAFALHDLSNRNPPTAPVSYPFLWGTHQSDFVQWNASSPNTPVVGPMVRNMAEAVGVFGNLSIEKTSWFRRLFGKKFKYTSTLDFHALGQLEAWVKSLKSPVWPEDILTPLDSEKVAKGELLFSRHCSSCHQVIARENEGLRYKSVKTPLAEVGTDPVMGWNAENHMSKTLILEGHRSVILTGKKFGTDTKSLNIAVDGIIGLVLSNTAKVLAAGLISEASTGPGTINDHVQEHINKRAPIPDDVNISGAEDETISSSMILEGLVYKARPLNGIWATAPYLHNGSVPNLWELLRSPGDRSKTFWVGDREFDPIHVGYNTAEGMNEFKVLNAEGNIQPGNSNLGHDYGTELTEDQKWALIEYMKTL